MKPCNAVARGRAPTHNGAWAADTLDRKALGSATLATKAVARNATLPCAPRISTSRAGPPTTPRPPDAICGARRSSTACKTRMPWLEVLALTREAGVNQRDIKSRYRKRPPSLQFGVIDLLTTQSGHKQTHALQQRPRANPAAGCARNVFAFVRWIGRQRFGPCVRTRLARSVIGAAGRPLRRRARANRQRAPTRSDRPSRHRSGRNAGHRPKRGDRSVRTDREFCCGATDHRLRMQRRRGNARF